MDTSSDRSSAPSSGPQQMPLEDELMRQMRHRHRAQLHSLVKMHLSFILELLDHEVQLPRTQKPASKSDGGGWRLLSFSARSKSKPSQSAADGCAAAGAGVVLSQEGVCQAYQLIEYLGRGRCLQVEGLFRKTGNIGRQQELGQQLVAGVSLDLDSGVYSAHDCACVLKWFLSGLSEPLLTSALYHAHLQVANLCPPDLSAAARPAARQKQVKALQLLFLLLPPENYQLLEDLLSLLHRVAACHEQNLMTAMNLGTLFAPHLLCRQQMSAAAMALASGTLARAVAVMIDEAPRLFVAPQELVIDVHAFLERQSCGAAASSVTLATREAPQVSTVFTFVDRQRSVAAGKQNDTETELASLYAHVSAMPDSARKRKLVKQFNRESGLGTPQLSAQRRRRSCTASLRSQATSHPSHGTPGTSGVRDRRHVSPVSPYMRRYTFKETTEPRDVSMYPTPSLAPQLAAGRRSRKLHRRSLLTPSTAGAVYSLTRGPASDVAGAVEDRPPRTARVGFKPQLTAAASSPLPGIARREKLTAKMHAFRTGRNNSLRHGQMPLRAIQLTSTPLPVASDDDGVRCGSGRPETSGSSPISCRLSDAPSRTVHQMLTPRNRRAVCLLSHGTLPQAPPSPPMLVPTPRRRSSAAADLQRIRTADNSHQQPSAERECKDLTAHLEATSWNGNDAFCCESTDVSRSAVDEMQQAVAAVEETNSSLRRRCSVGDVSSPVDCVPRRVSILVTQDSGISSLAESTAAVGLSSPFQRYLLQHQMSVAQVMDCSADGDAVVAAGDLSREAAATGQRLLVGQTELSDSLLRCLDGCEPDAGTEDLIDQEHEMLNTQTADETDINSSSPTPVHDGSEVTWADASSFLDSNCVATEVSSGFTDTPGDDPGHDRRRTLTDRQTNPLAQRKIGAPRRSHMVVFETNL